MINKNNLKISRYSQIHKNLLKLVPKALNNIILIEIFNFSQTSQLNGVNIKIIKFLFSIEYHIIN
jgi:hypothetical protein